ncbi:MAG TPA: SprT family zinc-dependent metalloprotease [Burkholderiales bacterium]|nr:SprT family zinc-dependent metalloprotease [Burkholderiales bacterium]
MSSALKQLRLPFDVSPQQEKSGRDRQVRLAGEIVSYKLVRARRRTIALFVDGNGIEARAPRHAAIAEIETFMREKERWIRRRLAAPRRPPIVWEAGTTLPWLGQSLTLALQPGEIGVRLSCGLLEVGLADGASLRERVLTWIRVQALALFRERVAALSRALDLTVSAVGLSNARTQWGSCSTSGRIRLNWRLMLLPVHLVDYVVAHELAHRRELNHSARFWNVVATLYPRYREARRELSALSKTLPEF